MGRAWQPWEMDKNCTFRYSGDTHRTPELLWLVLSRPGEEATLSAEGQQACSVWEEEAHSQLEKAIRRLTVPVEHAWQTTRPQLLQWWRCDLRRVHSANFFWQTKMEHLSASLSGCHNLQGTCRPVTNPLAPDGMPLSGVPCSIEEPCEDTCEFVGDIGRASVASSSFEEVGVDGASRNKHGSEHAVLVLAYSVLKRDLVVAIMTFRCGSPPRGVSLPHTTPNDFGTQSRKKSFR